VGCCRDKERVALAHDHVVDPPVLDDPHDDVALELVEELLAVGHVKVVSRVRTLDDHHEEVFAVVQVLVADRRLHLMAVLFDPLA
jgi:hypothetical protein